MERFVQYFDELLKNQNIGELEVPPTEDDGQVLPLPSMEETVRAIRRLKNHKSPGPDEIAAELEKYGGDQLQLDQLVQHNNEINKRYHDRLVVDKIRHSKLRWAGHLIRMDEDGPTQKVYKGNIYGRKRKRGRPCLRWSDVVGQNAKDIELVDLGAKPGCLEFLIKAGLEWIPIVVSLMMVKKGTSCSRNIDICGIKNYYH